MSNPWVHKIKENFNRAYLSYDQCCSIQNKVADEAIGLLLKYVGRFDVICDVACGTGESTRKLIERINCKLCYGVDFAEKLLFEAESKLPSHVKLIHSDFDEEFFQKKSIDLVFCNMGLQWSLNLKNTLLNFNRFLKENGWLVFSIPISDNFPELKEEYKSKMIEHEGVAAALLDTGFKLLECVLYSYKETFPTAYAALKSIKNVGANTLMRAHITKHTLPVKLDDRFVDPTEFSLTYRIGIYVAQKI